MVLLTSFTIREKMTIQNMDVIRHYAIIDTADAVVNHGIDQIELVQQMSKERRSKRQWWTQ